jgi:peptide/nickel transport system substrate-binding protein
VLALTVVGCAGQSSSSSGTERSAVAASSSAPKRITMAVLQVPLTFRDSRDRPFPELAAAGLTMQEENGRRHAVLVDAIPSAENGLWKVFSDGRMETTWRLREGTKWHDGRPLTSDDLVFTAMLARDKDLPSIHDAAFDLIEGVDAPDPRTVTVRWREPFINADTLFSAYGFVYTTPLPRHMLEQSYLQDKTSFEDLPYWTMDFVSTGPFKVRTWDGSNHILLDAFDDFALGRPKLDQVDVQVIGDPTVIVANAAAGAVDLTARTAVSMDLGVTIRDRWQEGKVLPISTGWVVMYPQFRVPDPPLMQEAQFRRALITAIDRQQLADSLTSGYSSVAHSIIPPDAEAYPAVESSIVRYDYDPRRSIQLLEGLGLARGSDGTFRDSSGRPISMEVRATQNDQNNKTMIAVADGFTRVGLTGVPSTVPRVVIQADEVNFPGFRLASQDAGANGIVDVAYGAAAPLPERGYRAPNWPRNRGSYANPEYDALMERYKTAVPMPQRMDALAQLVHFQTDQVVVFGMFYSVTAVLMSNRLQHAEPATAWNAYEWDVSS